MMAAMVMPSSPPQAPCLGDWVVLDGYLTPTDAQILASCLTEAGIHAQPGDVNTAQLWADAIGGAKVRVPQSQLAQAREVLDAFHRGEFALGNDFDAEDKSE
jgi:hypothetical protein